jgi:hypothetical protein
MSVLHVSSWFCVCQSSDLSSSRHIWYSINSVFCGHDSLWIDGICSLRRLRAKKKKKKCKVEMSSRNQFRIDKKMNARDEHLYSRKPNTNCHLHPLDSKTVVQLALFQTHSGPSRSRSTIGWPQWPLRKRTNLRKIHTEAIIFFCIHVTTATDWVWVSGWLLIVKLKVNFFFFTYICGDR